MVGVPRLDLWPCGPSSRISWPKPCRENTRIRYGVSRMDTTRRDRGRDQDALHAAPPFERQQSRPGASSASATAEPATLEALTSTTSPGPQLIMQQRDGGVDVGHRAPTPRPMSLPGRARGGWPRPPVLGPTTTSLSMFSRDDQAGRSRRGRRSRRRRARPSRRARPRSVGRFAAAHRRERAFSAARMDSGLALYESLTMVTPSGRGAHLHPARRHAARRRRAPAATSSGVAPSSSATAAAASALPTWCAPCSASATSAAPAGVTSRKEARACSSSVTSAARTSACSASPTSTTRALGAARHGRRPAGRRR